MYVTGHVMSSIAHAILLVIPMPQVALVMRREKVALVIQLATVMPLATAILQHTIRLAVATR